MPGTKKAQIAIVPTFKIGEPAIDLVLEAEKR
jgi:hypothetical protein